MQHRDGYWVPVLSRAYACRDSESGQVVRFVGTHTDLTPQKEAEWALLQARDQLAASRDRAEQANRAKSIFLANMSHEIRTPMNAILGYAQLLQRNQGLDSETRQTLQTINASGEHLLGLINDILDMSRIEAGKLELAENEFDPYAMIGDLKAMFSQRAAARGLALRVSVDDQVPGRIHADQGKLRQILINLLGNALKFTHQGSVTMALNVSEPPSQPGHSRIRFTLTDSGEGIAEHRINSIFNAFEQADAAQRAGGTGLGLAISREMAQLMGGELSAVSTLGEGSRFVLEIPVRVLGGAVRKPQSQADITGIRAGQTVPEILVVDDNPENRELLISALEPLGFTLLEAEDGIAAVELVQQKQPGILLMDVVMPRLSGIEACRRIRGIADIRQPLIIAITASATLESNNDILDAGADLVLHKPVRLDSLLQALEQQTGLEFEYASAASAAVGAVQPAPRADAIDAGCRQSILACLDVGDMNGLRAQVEQLRAADESVARYLAALVSDYQLEAIRTFLGHKRAEGACRDTGAASRLA